MGRIDVFLSPKSSAIVLAGIVKTLSANAAPRLSVWAVMKKIVALALLATPISASAVENSHLSLNRPLA